MSPFNSVFLSIIYMCIGGTLVLLLDWHVANVANDVICKSAKGT